MSIKYECDNIISERERERNKILKYFKIKREEHTIKMWGVNSRWSYMSPFYRGEPNTIMRIRVLIENEDWHILTEICTYDYYLNRREQWTIYKDARYNNVSKVLIQRA